MGYIGTGSPNSSLKEDGFWEYNPALDSWTQKASFGGGIRTVASGFSIDSRCYLGTGYESGFTWPADLWEYTPDSQTSISALSPTFISSIYPNPFFWHATLVIEIPQGADLELDIFNMQGKLIGTISNITTNKVFIERDNLLSGMYFYTLKSVDGLESVGKFPVQ